MPTSIPSCGSARKESAKSRTVLHASGARAAVKAAGGEMKPFYLTMGAYDAVVVAEAPGDEVFATTMLTNASAGAVRTDTLRAYYGSRVSRDHCGHSVIIRAVATLIITGLVMSGMTAPGVNAEQAQTSRVTATTERDYLRLLERFAEAWNRHDLDALMSMMTSDGVFEASGGAMVNGERYEGQRAVRDAYAAIFATYPDAHWGNARHFVAGSRGVSEWTFTGTMKDGRRVEVTGCDLFTFRDGKIALKNSYRKNRPPIG